MSAAALILARGGSRGVPRKNLHPIGSFPLLLWPLAAAAAAVEISRIVVVTDDPEIAGLASGRAHVLDEPPHLAEDHIGDLPVFRWALDALGLQRGLVAHLRATSPFVSSSDIDAAVRYLSASPHLTCLRSVRLARDHPQKMYREAPDIGGSPTLVPYTGAIHAANNPRQGLTRAWVAAGYLDVFRAEVILGPDGPEGAVIGRCVAPCDGRAVDLDTYADFDHAASIAQARGWRPGTVP